MHLYKNAALVAVLFLATLACRTSDIFIAQANQTPTPTRTLRPSITPIPSATNTAIPTPTVAPSFTPTATRRPPTARPPTPRPQPTAVPQPTVSTMEFHVNPPSPCQHSGISFLKGTVYLDKNDPNSKYVGAIVALGPTNGSTIYDVVKTDGYGEYTFVLAPEGQSKPGTWGIWLVTPSHARKSDIGGPITTNDLPAGTPGACWTSGVDFWK